ncbi:MAG: hypothetical protein HYY06_28230 [Deltaproteobacteria bacterium]|nr:hypothetical protein [Deltaproteobacteria bacterium]
MVRARLADPAAEAFFFRTHTGIEVDVLLRLRGRLVPIEVKLGVTPPDPKGLVACMDALGLPRGYVVSMRREAVEIRRGIVMCGLPDLLQRLQLAP